MEANPEYPPRGNCPQEVEDVTGLLFRVEVLETEVATLQNALQEAQAQIALLTLAVRQLAQGQYPSLGGDVRGNVSDTIKKLQALN